MYGNAAHAYRARQVQGATPVQQVAMLYDRAIASLREAIDAIEQGDIERRWRANNRAVEIISALMSGLDMEQGGEIAQNLKRLYTFLLRRLGQVDLKNDPQPAREAIDILDPLRQSWHQLSRTNGQPQQASGAEDAAGAPPQPQDGAHQPLNLAT
jgi:flagellar protein FliS